MQGKTQGHQGAQSDRQSGRNGNYSLIISSQIEISLYANQQRLSLKGTRILGASGPQIFRHYLQTKAECFSSNR
jgi:hypothetical protein